MWVRSVVLGRRCPKVVRRAAAFSDGALAAVARFALVWRTDSTLSSYGGVYVSQVRRRALRGSGLRRGTRRCGGAAAARFAATAVRFALVWRTDSTFSSYGVVLLF